MRREFGLDQIKYNERSVLTVGTFDGVHVGHQKIIAYLIERARQKEGVSVAVSFDPHPREIIAGHPVALLSTIEERAEALAALGLDRFIVIPFTQTFAELSAASFVLDVLKDKIGLREIVIGYDHGFGKGRKGDSVLLRELGVAHGFDVDIIPAKILEKDVVSSTRIREVIATQGDVGMAQKLLGRPYGLSGVVIAGDGRGRQIGYPTANVQVANTRKVIPKDGVYAVRVRTEEEPTILFGMMNIGMRPTFDGREKRLEVHLFDFHASLYGRTLTVDFVRRIRDEQKFSSIDALTQQLSRDKVRCRAILESVT